MEVKSDYALTIKPVAQEYYDATGHGAGFYIQPPLKLEHLALLQVDATTKAVIADVLNSVTPGRTSDVYNPTWSTIPFGEDRPTLSYEEDRDSVVRYAEATLKVLVAAGLSVDMFVKNAPTGNISASEDGAKKFR